MDNQHDQMAPAKRTSKWKGVHWKGSAQKWAPNKRPTGVLYQHCLFDDEADAAQMHNFAVAEGRGGRHGYQIAPGSWGPGLEEG